MPPYDVGYRKPPKASQFKKGRSGNPRGRPKGIPSLANDLAVELNERVTIKEDGRPRRISKQRALIKTLLAKALQCDTRAIACLVTLCDRKSGESRGGQENEVDDSEFELLKRFEPQIQSSLAKRTQRK